MNARVSNELDLHRMAGRAASLVGDTVIPTEVFSSNGGGVSCPITFLS